MQKRIGFAVSKTKIFFSLCSISNHALTIILRLSQCLSFPETPGFLNCCPLPGSSKEVISHKASLLPSPQVSLTVAPFLGASKRWSVSSPTHWGRTWLGSALGPYLMLWPFLVSWSIPPVSPVGAQLSGESEHQPERDPGMLSGGKRPCSSWSSFAPAQPSRQSNGSRGWHGWNLTGASRSVAKTSTGETKHHKRRVGELRFITLVGPEELTLQALSPEQRGYRVFIDRLEWATLAVNRLI